MIITKKEHPKGRSTFYNIDNLTGWFLNRLDNLMGRHVGIRHFGIRHVCVRHIGIRHRNVATPSEQKIVVSNLA
jgi:hypothetical protein